MALTMKRGCPSVRWYMACARVWKAPRSLYRSDAGRGERGRIITLLVLLGALIDVIVATIFLGGVTKQLTDAGKAIKKQYDEILQTLNGNSPTGAGQKIGIPAFSRVQLSDVADWLALVGLPANLINQVSQVPVNGSAPLGSDQGDVLLAINTILAIAPGAQVVIYHAPFAGLGTTFQTLFNTMINDHVTIISNSFSSCEDQTTLADVQSIAAILATAAISGIPYSMQRATAEARVATALRTLSPFWPTRPTRRRLGAPR